MEVICGQEGLGDPVERESFFAEVWPGKDNPADMMRRGVLAATLVEYSFCWRGSDGLPRSPNVWSSVLGSPEECAELTRERKSRTAIPHRTADSSQPLFHLR